MAKGGAHVFGFWFQNECIDIGSDNDDVRD